MKLKDYVSNLEIDFKNNIIGCCECYRGNCIKRKIKILDIFGENFCLTFETCNANISLMKDNVDDYDCHYGYKSFISILAARIYSHIYYIEENKLNYSFGWDNHKSSLEDCHVDLIVSYKPFVTIRMKLFDYLQYIVDACIAYRIIKLDNFQLVSKKIKIWIDNHNNKTNLKKSILIKRLLNELEKKILRYRVSGELLIVEINNILIEIINYKTLI